MEIVLRTLDNCVVYIDSVLSKLRFTMQDEDQPITEIERQLRLFWRQISLFNNNLLSALALEGKTSEIDNYSEIIEDLNKRAELAEKAQDRIKQSPAPHIEFKQTSNRELQKKYEEVCAAFVFLTPFLQSIGNLKPGTPLSQEYVSFAQNCIESGVHSIGKPVLDKLELAETERDAAMRALIESGLAIPTTKESK